VHTFTTSRLTLPPKIIGGQLIVRNSNKESVFDWSTPSDQPTNPTVQWAAFYSDCEHEVFEVTSGHRLTLTYNLYIRRGSGHLTGHCASTHLLDPTRLPVYETLHHALSNPSFLPCGRVLAIWLRHSYAHTHKELNFLPSSLKGSDMVLYETSRALGLQCYLHPVVEYEHYDHEADEGKDTMVLADSFQPYNSDMGYDDEDENKQEILMRWGDLEVDEGRTTWLNAQNWDKCEPAFAYTAVRFPALVWRE
jgi:hypothetical protein